MRHVNLGSNTGGETNYISVAFVIDKAIHSLIKHFNNTCHVPNMLGHWEYEEREDVI